MVQLSFANPAGLMAPGPHGVESDHVQRRRREGRFRRLPLALELAERACEAGGEGVRDVVISGNREHRPRQPVQEPRSARKLVRATAMAEIAAGDDELRL